jgi:hypothetical protein
MRKRFVLTHGIHTAKNHGRIHPGAKKTEEASKPFLRGILSRKISLSYLSKAI